MHPLACYFIVLIIPVFAQAQPDSLSRIGALEAIMEQSINHEGKQPLHNFMLFARNEKQDFTAHLAKGIIGHNNQPIRIDDQFKIASITKTFVATVTLQLIEQGKISLEDKLVEYLHPIEYLKFDEFLYWEGKPVSSKITIAQCLRHLSGVADIFTDKETRFVLRVLTHKRKSYDEAAVVKLYYKYRLHKQGASQPGEGYHYSDMNYMLLGFVIEQVTGKSLAANIRERILHPLQMTNTYFEYYEPISGTGRQIDTYLNKLNITQKVNTSYEWGGGGLVSTVRDQATFIEALFNLKLFANPATLADMINLDTSKKFGKEAGMGIFHYVLGGKSFYGHGGFYGSLLLYCPEEKITLVINIGQANAEIDPIKTVENIVEVTLGVEEQSG